MKKNYFLFKNNVNFHLKLLIVALGTLFFSQESAAQVSVTATAGTLSASYATVKGAFDAVNAGTHQGVVSISLTGNTTETASAVLNSGAVLPASYTSVAITATIPVTVSGNIVGAIIKLNGADNVSIDGRIGGTGRNITIQNTSTSASTAAVWLASVAAGNGCLNNVVRNLELACGVTQNTSTSSTFGIIMSGTTISTTSNGVDNDNNTFTQNRIIRSRYGIVTRGTTTDLNQNIVVSDNIIGPVSFGADEIGKVGIFMQCDNAAMVSGNTVQFVGGYFADTTGGADRVGIGIGQESWSMSPTTLTSTNYTVKNNIIHDVIEERTFSSVGLLLATVNGGAATNDLIINNEIYNVRANATSGDQTVGLGISGGHTAVIANNSISLVGDVDPSASATGSGMFGSGIRIANASSASHANITLVNNSVYMDLSSSSTATNRYYAISGNSAAYAFGTGSENYNNYYINAANPQQQTGGLGTTSGNTLTTQFATLANWQTAYTATQDANSIQGNPLYVSSSDLHLLPASPNVNTGTTVASITTDIDGEARPNGAAYDIGFDEFYATPGVLQLSSNAYAGNEGTTLVVTVNRTGGSSGAVGVTYTLTDGTATGAAACGIGTDYTNLGAQTLSFADGEVSKTFNVSLCTDLVVDANETFSIALSSPTGGASLGTTTNATATITDVPPPFNGTYTVGTAGNYPSLTNPGGIFEALNLAGATGNITINIISDLTGETGTNSLNEIAGGFSTLIQPFGAARTVTGSNTGALLKLNGADNVTINGSTTGATVASCLVGGDAALRELTFQNTNTGTSAAVISVQSGTNGAMNNSLKNLNVVGQDPTTTLLGISLGGSTPGTVGTDNDNNRVENCSVQKAIFGIYAAGASLANQNAGTVITQNDLSATGGNRIRRVGMVLFNDNGATVSYNSVAVDTNESADGIGIALGVQAIDATTTTSGGITGALVTNNKVNGVVSSSTTGFSAIGISVAGATGTPNVIQNNMISGVTSPATSPDLTAGIYVVGAAGTDTRLYNNTVAMTGDRGAVGSQMPCYAIAITGSDPIIDLRDNILSNSQIASGGGANAKAYAIGMVTSTFANLNSNYNDFVSSGANDGGFRSGSLSTASGTDYATVALWGTAISDDANSVEITPVFVSSSDLHLDSLNNPTLDNLGTPIATVTQDFDCGGRDASTPDMGADEINFLATTHFDTVQGFNAYPNPTSGVLNIEYTSDLSGIAVFNMLGQQVLYKKVNATSGQVDLSELNSGTYLVKIQAGEVSKTLKVIKN